MPFSLEVKPSGYKTNCFVYKRLQFCIQVCIVHCAASFCYSCFDLGRLHLELIAIWCLVALLYFLVIIFLRLRKSLKCSSSKTRNTHSKGKPETFSTFAHSNKYAE